MTTMPAMQLSTQKFIYAVKSTKYCTYLSKAISLKKFLQKA